MSLQTGMNRQRWVHVVTAGLACGAMAAAVMGGLGAPTVWADPAADPSAQSDAPPVMTADEALAIKPSNTNKEAITKALDYRPNQAPLIQALQETLSYQRKMQALAQNANKPSQPGFSIGGPPPGMGAPVAPGVP